MKHSPLIKCLSVTILTVAVSFVALGCSSMKPRTEELCNNRAYTATDMESFLMQRFHKGSPVRLGIIPFSAPANIAGRSAELPGIGKELAWKVRNDLLAHNFVPIVEILNRVDWPGKKEEYFSGNFGAISMARDAGYDLVMVGYVDKIRSLTGLTAYSKIIEVESGTTLFSLKSTAQSYRKRPSKFQRYFGIGEPVEPSRIATEHISSELAYCIVDRIVQGDSDK